MDERHNLLKRLERLEEEVAQLRVHILESESAQKAMTDEPTSTSSHAFAGENISIL